MLTPDPGIPGLPPPLQRGFVHTPDGALHVRYAGSGATGAPPLLLLHPSPNCGRHFEPLLPLLAPGRLVLAVDTPGFGESFRPQRPPTIADYARAMAALIAALGFEYCDVLGQFTGAGIGAELASRFPERVRRLVLLAPPLFTAAQQAQLAANAWPQRPRDDGGHLLAEWRKIMTRAAPDLTLDARLDLLVDYYRGGANAIWGEEAIATYPLADVLPRIGQRVLVIAPQGVQGDATAAHALLRDGELVAMAASGYTLLRTHAAPLARIVTDFLDAEPPATTPASARTAAHSIRRGFVDTPGGQVHFRTLRPGASPAGLPLVCLHQSPFSSLTYQEILPLLGAARPVVALDTPGFGESFRPAGKPAIGDYAEALLAAARALGLGRFDLMGLFTGAAIGADLAARHPGAVRRLVLIGPPLFSPEQQERFVRDAWPARPRPDGSHLLPEWERVMNRALPGVPFARRCDAFQEFWRGGADAIWGEEAVSVYPLRETLPRVLQPVLVLEPDGLHGNAEAAAGLLPNARRLRLEGVHAWSMMQTAPERIAMAACAFLDADD